jgi:hypothetical protein
MANNSNQEAPDPPWFTKPVAPNIPSFAAINQFGQSVKLPYLQYGLIDNEPFLLGTTERFREVYGEHLKAFPMLTLPLESHVNDEALEALYTDHPFNWTLNDTILTPFSLSSMTDTAVDSLPELFLAYCTLADSDDVKSDDDRVVPRGSDSDSVPLLTSCAVGLSSTFLSRSRR